MREPKKERGRKQEIELKMKGEISREEGRDAKKVISENKAGEKKVLQK